MSASRCPVHHLMSFPSSVVAAVNQFACELSNAGVPMNFSAGKILNPHDAQ
jgi:hypothetical protein